MGPDDSHSEQSAVLRSQRLKEYYRVLYAQRPVVRLKTDLEQLAVFVVNGFGADVYSMTPDGIKPYPWIVPGEVVYTFTLMEKVSVLQELLFEREAAGTLACKAGGMEVGARPRDTVPSGCTGD